MPAIGDLAGKIQHSAPAQDVEQDRVARCVALHETAQLIGVGQADARSTEDAITGPQACVCSRTVKSHLGYEERFVRRMGTDTDDAEAGGQVCGNRDQSASDPG